MKLALALLLVAAPLTAQTASNQKIVFNVVVTLVNGSATTPPGNTPGSTSDQGSGSTSGGTQSGTSTPPADPSSGTGSTSSGCVSYYAGAASSMNDVTNSLIQAQQLYSNAYASGAINSSVFASGNQTLAVVRLDNSDARDIVRIAGPSDVIAQNISFVSAEINTLPGMLGSTSQLSSSLSTLAASMHASLAQASKLIASSTCARAIP